MSLSPKQIASKAVISVLPQFISSAKDAVSKYVENGAGNKLIKTQKAREHVDKLVAGFKIKMDKLGKRFESAVDQIDKADKADEDDSAGF